MFTSSHIVSSLGLLVMFLSLESCSAIRSAFSTLERNPATVALAIGAISPIEVKIVDILEKKQCPEHVVCDGKSWKPEPGYDWVDKDAKEFTTKWTPGRTHSEHIHIVAASSVGQWQPESGYRWNSGGGQSLREDSENLEVIWSPGVSHNEKSHIVADEKEQYWKTVDGYIFVDSTPGTLETEVNCQSQRWQTSSGEPMDPDYFDYILSCQTSPNSRTP